MVDGEDVSRYSCVFAYYKSVLISWLSESTYENDIAVLIGALETATHHAGVCQVNTKRLSNQLLKPGNSLLCIECWLIIFVDPGHLIRKMPKRVARSWRATLVKNVKRRNLKGRARDSPVDFKSDS